MKASVIILNHNGKQYLRDCLQSLMKQTYKDFEVILYDNNSSDGSIDFVLSSFPSVKVMWSCFNRGFSIGCNEAIKYSEGNYIVLLNNDTVVEEHWLEELVNAMDRCDIATSKIVKMRYHNVIDSVGIEYKECSVFPLLRGTGEHDYGQYDKEEYIWGASGCSMMIKREVIDEIGLFDPSYFAYCEDVDFCWRANKAGKRIIYVPSSVVYHCGGGTSKKGLDITFLIERNKARTIKKHGSMILKIRFIISELMTMIKSEIGYRMGRNSIGFFPYFNAIMEMIK